MGKDAKGKGKGKTCAKRVFERPGSSADAELVEGVWPHQELLSFSARFFLRLTKWRFFFLLWAAFFRCVYPRTFFCSWFFHRNNRKELPCGNFCQVRHVNKNMQMTWNMSDELLPRKFPQESCPLTRLWHLRSLLTLSKNTFFLNNSATFWDF